ncbi:MAG: hypothetical protein VB997_00125, partial [Opitutales bacterium]
MVFSDALGLVEKEVDHIADSIALTKIALQTAQAAHKSAEVARVAVASKATTAKTAHQTAEKDVAVKRKTAETARQASDALRETQYKPVIGQLFVAAETLGKISSDKLLAEQWASLLHASIKEATELSMLAEQAAAKASTAMKAVMAQVENLKAATQVAEQNLEAKTKDVRASEEALKKARMEKLDVAIGKVETVTVAFDEANRTKALNEKALEVAKANAR